MKVRYFAYQSHDAATNMAIDQVLVQSAAETGIHCLRFYGWSEATLSIGYFQAHRDGDQYRSDHGVPAAIRRSTGGGAIVHHHDLTYSIALATDGRTAADRDRLYRQTHDAWIQSLAAAGISATTHQSRPAPPIINVPNPFLCFERRAAEDLIVSDYKVLGSAQRRIRGGLLQHGSVLLAASPHAAVLPGLWQLTGVAMEPAGWADDVATQLATTLGWTLVPSTLTDSQWEDVRSLQNERFADDLWWSQR